MSELTDVRTEAARLARLLGAWAAASLATAMAGSLVGWKTKGPVLAGVVRQSLAWGTVDGAIAVLGARRNGEAILSPADEEAEERARTEDAARARRLRNVLALNVALDVGYVAVGVAMLRRRPRRGDGDGLRTRDLRGDGAVVVAQGMFLLGLDAAYAQRMGRLAHRLSRPPQEP